MGLKLLAGPANAGKVALLLERYLGALESDPFLIVPNRPDVDRAERELLARSGALVGGSIGTFDDVFARLARSNGAHKPVVTQAQRTLLLRRLVAHARTQSLARSARFTGFADALGATVAELEAALFEPGRDAFASLRRTADDLSALAENVEELPASQAARSPVLAHLERGLFGEAATPAPESDGSLRFLEGAGLRGTLELVAEEILGL